MGATRAILPILATGLIAAAVCQARAADGPERGEREPPAYDDFIVIPLRVHILSARDLSEIDCHLSDRDVDRVLKKVNRIWHRAGIHWGLESLVREPAARPDRFLRARDLDGGDNPRVYRILFPDETRRGDFVNLYYIHEFSMNGVWLGREAVVKETAKLRTVKGGIDEPIPRVTAHELGHALGLSHRENRTNLLASGTTGTELNAAEVEAARERARDLAGAMTVGQVRERAQAAESTGDRRVARRLWTWLAEVPGIGADAARTHLDRLHAERSDRPGQGSGLPSTSKPR
jgi:hypothetical protein